MSSNPRSPPRTPFKPPATVNGITKPQRQENLPIPIEEDGATTQPPPPSSQLSPPEAAEVEAAILVPATPKSKPAPPLFKEPESIRRNGVETPNQQRKEVDGDETEEEDEGAADEEDLEADLPTFKWADIQQEYVNRLNEVDEEEEQLLEQYVAYSNLFQSWAIAGAERTNSRAVKRLKTREKYVQLSEESLEKKKKHHETVVKAFQDALDLLGGR
ncbi:hypothetical protein G7Y89_g1234 [Cudoniella acicularis]|uniref:Uncharacterized protein n=1 Tax=Cudoniella acicularis TaxID=354080 RepID=A0A8H4RVP4_9HELO|nr:hypothetical protein G7Y89_g1234 [Cudoniella acicularis]